ncbi:MAG: alpha/beta fold hydrolase [Burkholderiaceae bacterium]
MSDTSPSSTGARSRVAAAAPADSGDAAPYEPCRVSRSLFLPVRGLQYHVRCWEPVVQQPAPAARTVFLLHGWMDVSASFQFVVDHLPPQWRLLAPDWRGFGLSDRAGRDTYWFPDYLGDLDCLLDALAGQQPVDLVAHSMGGNVATLYAGVRPGRVRRLINLEGVGMPASRPDQAPGRYLRWLDELKTPQRLRPYASLAEVADRLRRTNPRLRPDFAAFLAQHWARPVPEGGFELLGDPVHKGIAPLLYQLDEVLACWAAIEAQVLWVLAEHQNDWHRFIHTPEYQTRLQVIRSLRRVTVADAGHMLHHDQPGPVARLIEEFLA